MALKNGLIAALGVTGFITMIPNVVNMVETGVVTTTSGALLAAQAASFIVPATVRSIRYFNQKSEDKRMDLEAERDRQESIEKEKERIRQEGINWDTPEIRAKREREEEVKKWKERIIAKSNQNAIVDKYADVKGRIDQEKRYIDSLAEAGKFIPRKCEEDLLAICADMERMQRAEFQRKRQDQENGTSRTAEAIQRSQDVEKQLTELRTKRANIYKLINDGLVRNYDTTQSNDDWIM